MSSELSETYGNQFYSELRRLSGYDFIELSYEDIQLLKAADRDTTFRLVLGNSSWRPDDQLSPQEFAAKFTELAKKRVAESQPSEWAAACGWLGELIAGCLRSM